MEPKELKSLVGRLFRILPETTWKGKSVSEIEVEVQQVLNQLGTHLLQQHLLPARVQEIEDSVHYGETRCDRCQQAYQLHKAGQAIHPKAIFGEKNHLES